jgi:hypothetical protein
MGTASIVSPPRRRSPRVALAGVLGAWVVATVALGAILLARHELAMPVPPPTDPALTAAVAARARPDAWTAIHVMYPACPCARRVIAHLRARPHPDGVVERVVLVADRPDHRLADALAARGFAVEHATPAVLAAAWHVEATPLLVLAAPGGALHYVGGYGRRKQSPTIEDLAIIADARRRAPPSALPVFGCATTRRLARAVDPLGFARWR